MPRPAHRDGGHGDLAADQFLRDGTNRRTDRYEGTVARRVRFLLAVVGGVGAWRVDRVGVRLSPRSAFNDMSDRRLTPTFGRAAAELSGRGLAYLHVMEPIAGREALAGPRVTPHLRERFRGRLILNGGYDGASAHAALDRAEGDLVSFGASFLANPDLPERLRTGQPLNAPDPARVYGGGENGHTDYPSLTPALA